MRVGPPGRLTTDRKPPTTSILSARPRSPRESASDAPPQLSSPTLMTRRPAVTSMRTVAALAAEYFAALLMAQGYSNDSICHRLVISRRTVESHVSSVFAKLGIVESPESSRRVLAVLAYLQD